MSLPQRAGQLFMVAASDTGPDAAATTAVRQYGVGSLILMGNSTLSVQGVASLTQQLQAAHAPGVGLFVATDQEGGQVQRLKGPGFGSIPSALTQSRQAPAQLTAFTAQWAAALRSAGVNLDLAPVADTVPAGTSNPPIGGLDRQYGSTPAATAQQVVAVLRGMQQAGVVPTVKHFPGLGRVGANTDFSGGVVDRVTIRGDAYLQPFMAAVQAGVPFVMVSTAVYQRIDPDRPAAFSPVVIGQMLRQDLGFQGVVISDDVGAAQQVAGLSPPQRALAFLGAGGDIVLTVDTSQIAGMTAAVVARAQADPAFAALVDAAALRVLRAKLRAGLLAGG
jgi:beta-N-acetylhexosaminidase